MSFHSLEFAVISHALLHGQDTSAAQELLSLHGGFEPTPKFIWVGLPNIWDFFLYRLGLLCLKYQLLDVST